MLKKILFLLGFMLQLFMGSAQQKTATPPFYIYPDSVSFQFVIDFDVDSKTGCEYLITQFINQTIYAGDDSLSYIWNLFNEDTLLTFTEENPDVFISEPGIYHIELIVINNYNHSDTLIKYNVITVDKMPEIDFTFTPENALFAEYLGEVTFTNLTDSELLNDSTVLWYWDFDDHFMNLKISSPVHLFSSWGDYHPTFHLETKNGCKVALTKTVTIEEELFFPDTLKTNSQKFPAVFAVTNLNTHIPQDDPDEFRTNRLFIYNAKGEKVYEQKNYDTYIKNNVIMQGFYAFNAHDFPTGNYYYSFYYKGKNKMVHYGGEVVID